ncbi:uncharacterized protein METZ01_LOCUS45729 [marine metagenome]|uniref:Uncharacterized protein n=1 Tax=marine metagenome TaxID=408172 RepID=A0A381RLZ0_9ZZZZ
MLQWQFDSVFNESGLYVFDNSWPIGSKLAAWGDFVNQDSLRRINGFKFTKSG